MQNCCLLIVFVFICWCKVVLPACAAPFDEGEDTGVSVIYTACVPKILYISSETLCCVHSLESHVCYVLSMQKGRYYLVKCLGRVEIVVVILCKKISVKLCAVFIL